MSFICTYAIGRWQLMLFEGNAGCELRGPFKGVLSFPDRDMALQYIERFRAARLGFM